MAEQRAAFPCRESYRLQAVVVAHLVRALALALLCGLAPAPLVPWPGSTAVMRPVSRHCHLHPRHPRHHCPCHCQRLDRCKLYPSQRDSPLPRVHGALLRLVMQEQQQQTQLQLVASARYRVGLVGHVEVQLQRKADQPPCS